MGSELFVILNRGTYLSSGKDLLVSLSLLTVKEGRKKGETNKQTKATTTNLQLQLSKPAAVKSLNMNKEAILQVITH